MRHATLLFPSDYYDTNKVDDDFQAEWDAAVACACFDCILFNFNAFKEKGVLTFHKPVQDPEIPLIYRGWAMDPEQYRLFYNNLIIKGLRPITNPDCYNALHLFSQETYERFGNSQDGESDLPGYPDTPVTIECEGTDINVATVNTVFKRFMITERAKSAKEPLFPRYIDTPISQDKLDTFISDFIKLRSEPSTEGIVLKEFVNLRRYDGVTNEWRAFYIAGSLLTLKQNSDLDEPCTCPPMLYVKACTSLGSPYCVVDFAELDDGSWIALELDDGQVAQLATTQDPSQYYRALSKVVQRCFLGYSNGRFEKAYDIVNKDVGKDYYISAAKDFGESWAFTIDQGNGQFEYGGPCDIAYFVKKNDFTLSYEPMSEVIIRWEAMPDIPLLR